MECTKIDTKEAFDALTRVEESEMEYMRYQSNIRSDFTEKNEDLLMTLVERDCACEMLLNRMSKFLEVSQKELSSIGEEVEMESVLEKLNVLKNDFGDRDEEVEKQEFQKWLNSSQESIKGKRQMREKCRNEVTSLFLDFLDISKEAVDVDLDKFRACVQDLEMACDEELEELKEINGNLPGFSWLEAEVKRKRAQVEKMTSWRKAYQTKLKELKAAIERKNKFQFEEVKEIQEQIKDKQYAIKSAILSICFF